jgi:hypothetical protein
MKKGTAVAPPNMLGEDYKQEQAQPECQPGFGSHGLHDGSRLYCLSLDTHLQVYMRFAISNFCSLCPTLLTCAGTHMYAGQSRVTKNTKFAARHNSKSNAALGSKAHFGTITRYM